MSGWKPNDWLTPFIRMIGDDVADENRYADSPETTRAARSLPAAPVQ
jgi:hypothetical protein